MAVIWITLAVEAGILYWLLYRRYPGETKRWRPIRNALTYLLVLSILTILTSATDMPGFVYVPGWFALITFVLLAAYSLAMWIGALWIRGKTAP
jgi:hypothetical protein